MLKNRVIVFGLFVTSSTFVYLEPNFITILLFYILIFIILFSYIHLLFANRNIVVTQIINPNRVAHSSNIKYTFGIENRSLLPYPLVRIRFKYAEDIFTNQLNELNITLHSEEKIEYNFDLSCKYRGTYSVGVDKVEIHDILNIFSVSISMKTPTVTVLPKVSVIAANKMKPKYLFSEFDRDTPSSLDEDTIKDIREYQKGDSLKNVHWKLFAKYNQLMIKEKENSAINKSIIFLDTKELLASFVENIIFQDKLLEAFLSTTLKLIDEHHVLDVLINNENLTESNNYSFESIFDTTSMVQFTTEDHKQSLRYFIEQNYQNKNISGIDVFVFTLKDSQKLQDTLIPFISNGMNVHVFVSNPDVEEGTFVDNNHIHYYHLEKTSNISDLFREIG